MIDLNYHRKVQPEKAEPEEIVLAVITTLLWIWILIGIMAGC